MHLSLANGPIVMNNISVMGYQLIRRQGSWNRLGSFGLIWAVILEDASLFLKPLV
jgi:hypothetical protein